jgi:hypothetical protein
VQGVKDLAKLDRYRNPVGETMPYGRRGDPYGGIFRVRSPSDPRIYLDVIASNGDGWDHVSVSTPRRCPSWPEMETVKRLFFEDHETAMQLHVATAEHISQHPYCLHIWRPHDAEIPLPPAIMVGRSRSTA